MAGIASKNLFDLLGDDATDPDQEPRPTKENKQSVKAPKATPGPSKPAATSTQREERPSRGGDRGRSGGRRGGRGEGGYRDRGDRPRYSEEGEEESRGGRGRGRGRPREGRGRENRGHYDDRHSKTGIAEHEKQASHGWGGNTGTAEFADEKAGEAIAKTDEQEAEKDGEANGEAHATDADATEQEPKVKTLDDFLAEQTKKRLQVSGALETRKPNEGASKKWQDGKEFSRDEQDENFIVGSSGKKMRERSKKEKTMVELDGDAMRPRDEPAERRGGRGSRGPRGGRGRGESGRGESGYRSERGRGGRGGRGGAAPNVSDISAFPTLGS